MDSLTNLQSLCGGEMAASGLASTSGSAFGATAGGTQPGLKRKVEALEAVSRLPFAAVERESSAFCRHRLDLGSVVKPIRKQCQIDAD